MRYFAATIIFALFAVCASAQTIEELQRQIEDAQEDIRITDELLSKTQKEQSNNRSQLNLVQTNISNRKKIVDNLDRQIGLVNTDVRKKTSSVNTLEKELQELKDEYRDMIVSSYKNYKTNNFMAFLFASKDFNDATRRIYYMKRYTAMRERKAETIDSVSTLLRGEIEGLNTKKSELDATVKSRNNEITKLNNERNNYQQIDSKLSSQAKKYNSDLAKKRKNLENLDKQLEKIIAEEARRAQNQTRTAAEEEALVKLTGSFAQNKGKLPYPVKGVVTRKTEMGVDISTSKGATARSVFDGEVIFAGAPNNNAYHNFVIIQHGNYFTTYLNIEKLAVKAGDKVSINQTLGTVDSSNDPDFYFLNFGIWEFKSGGSRTILDPRQWLKR